MCTPVHEVSWEKIQDTKNEDTSKNYYPPFPNILIFRYMPMTIVGTGYHITRCDMLLYKAKQKHTKHILIP